MNPVIEAESKFLDSKNNLTPQDIQLLWNYSREGNLELIDKLLEENKGFSQKDLNLALLEAVKYFRSTSDHLDCCNTLLSNGASADAEDENGVTALMYASEKAENTLVELLVERGANVLKKDKKQKTCLFYAIESKADNADVVNTILKQNVPVNSEDIESATPLIRASQKCFPNIIKSLIKAGAMVNFEYLSIQDTPLHIIARQKLGEPLLCAKILVENGADINKPNKQKQTPLDICQKFGLKEVYDFLFKEKDKFKPHELNLISLNHNENENQKRSNGFYGNNGNNVNNEPFIEKEAKSPEKIEEKEKASVLTSQETLDRYQIHNEKEMGKSMFVRPDKQELLAYNQHMNNVNRLSCSLINQLNIGFDYRSAMSFQNFPFYPPIPPPPIFPNQGFPPNFIIARFMPDHPIPFFTNLSPRILQPHLPPPPLNFFQNPVNPCIQFNEMENGRQINIDISTEDKQQILILMHQNEILQKQIKEKEEHIKNIEKQKFNEKEAQILNLTKENNELKEEIKNLQTQLLISRRDYENLKDDFNSKLNEKEHSINSLKERIQTIEQMKTLESKESPSSTSPSRTKRNKNVVPDSALFNAINLNNDIYEENLIVNRLNFEMEEFARCIKSLNLKFEVLRKQIIEKFSNLVTQYNNSISAEIYGSWATELILPWSDIDIVLSSHKNPLSLSESSKIMNDLKNKLEKEPWVKNCLLIESASMPVMKIISIANSEEIKLDLTIQDSRHRGLECVKLVKSYLHEYPHIVSVVLLMKFCLKLAALNEPYSGGIGSYGLFLMIISYLQYLKTFKKHKESPGILLLGFLKYYINFNYLSHGIAPHKPQLELNYSPFFELLDISDVPTIIDPVVDNNNVGKSTRKFMDIKLLFHNILVNSKLKCYCPYHSNNSPEPNIKAKKEEGIKIFGYSHFVLNNIFTACKSFANTKSLFEIFL